MSTLIWGFAYGAKYGLVGSFNSFFDTHFDAFAPNMLLASIGNIVTWEYTGYNMLIFYSSLSTIPHSLYEAASIDGASEWAIVKSIKLPELARLLSYYCYFSPLLVLSSCLMNQAFCRTWFQVMRLPRTLRQICMRII